MNKRKLLTLAALATLALSSCTNQEDPAERNNSLLPADRVIRISAAGVNGMADTRAGWDSENLRNFGLYITNAQANAYSYENVWMQKDILTDRWAPYNDDGTPRAPLLWSSAHQAVTVTAYAPYASAMIIKGGVLTSAIRPDQSDPGLLQFSDLLWASATVTPSAPNTKQDIYYDTSSQGLAVQMNHVLSKLRINLRYAPELMPNGTAPTPVKVTLCGTNLEYKLTLSDGTVTAGTAAPSIKDIAMYQDPAPEDLPTGYHAACEAIVVPQAAAFSLRITIGGQEYLYIHTDADGKPAPYEFESGVRYTLNLMVGEITDTRAAGIRAAGSRAVIATAFCSEEWNERK